MLCVDLKNSFYQLPDVHGGLYDLNNSSIDEEIVSSSNAIETIREEKIPCNEYFSDLTKQEQCIGKYIYIYYTIYTVFCLNVNVFFPLHHIY